MGIGNRLVFDINNNVEDFIFILSTKDFRHLGALQNVVPDSVSTDGNLSSINTINFEVYKAISVDDNDIEDPLWDEIDNLKLVYVRELDTYFEIEVQLDDTTGIVKKTVNGISLCESELSQINIHGLEVNTEIDIDRPDYEPTVFYNPKNTKTSLLNRAISFAPHYTIKHVDESLWNIQRTFSVDETPIYDWLMGDCANEFNCVFQFESSTRGIYVYDLYTVCKDCGHRGEYMDECPECGGKNLKYFGTDTTIYIDKENLTDAIQFTTDVGSIKNCLKLVAGDELLTSVIKTINPGGSDFIIKPTDSQLAEMPEILRNKIISYNELYSSKKDEYEKIIADLYETSSKIDYYTHTMMPTVEHAEVTAKTEANKLTKDNLDPIGISKLSSSTNIATVESVLKNYVKVFVKTGYVNVDINQSNYKFVGKDSDGYNYGTWTGNFKVTNYSDEEDVAYSNTIAIKVTENYQDFIEQKILKNIATNSDEEDSVFDVLSIKDLSKFKEALKRYCVKRLESFADAVQSALDVLIEVDQASESADLYNVFYKPYFDKLQACQNELNTRNATIAEWRNIYDNLTVQKEEMQAELNFADYLGEDLYMIFSMYRREDTYQNDNYKSDGLSDSQLIQKARDFMEVAEKQLEKARTPKHSISSTLYNLLLIPEFKPLLHFFKLGNWLRISVDDELYRLRLIGYKLNFSSIQTLEVTFSNVTKVNTAKTPYETLESTVNSIATNFNTFIEQAKKGNEANVEIRKWLEDGLNSALTNIKNNNNEEIVIDKHGLWARTYNSETENYDPEQLRVTHNILCYSDDGFQTVRTALGKHNYYKFNEQGKLVQDTAYGLSCDFVTAGYVYGSQIIGGNIFSENYSSTTGSHINLNTGAFTFAGGKLVYNSVTNKLTLTGVNIDWSSSTTPKISDIDGLTEDLVQKSASIKANADAITMEVNRASEAEGKLSSKIEITAENITSTVAKTYETKTDAQSSYNNLSSTIEQTAESITSKVDAVKKDLSDNYSTTTEMNSAIKQTADNINLSVNQKITATEQYADNVANKAESNAKADTTNKLKSYSTTSEMNAAIDIKANTITSTVNDKFTETKEYIDGQIESTTNDYSSKIEQTAKSITSKVDAVETNLKNNYSTTTQMNSAISQTANNITSEVNAVKKDLSDNYSTTSVMNSAISQSASNITSTVATTYETKSNAGTQYQKLQSSITQNANNIELKVSNNELISKINVSTEAISLSGNRIIIDSTNLKVSKDGTITAMAGEIGGCSIVNGVLKIKAINITDTLTIGQLPSTVAETSDIPTKVSQLNNDSGYQNESGVVTIAKGAITADYIKTLNLEVGNQIKMGSNAKITWDNVTNQPTIPSKVSQLTNDSGYETASSIKSTVITKNYIETLNIKAGSVDAENISGTTLSGKTISGGSITIGSNFKVDTSGNITGKGGTIGGWTINGSKIYGGDATTGVAAMQLPTANTTWVFAAGGTRHDSYGDTSDGSACPFRVSKSGKLYASDVVITGGSLNIGNGAFKVTNAGILTATGANINGKLTCATGSSVGGFKTDSNSIFKGTWGSSGTTPPDIFMCTGSNNNYSIGGSSQLSGWCFGAGKNFGVTVDGAMYCGSGQIGNFTITSSYLEGTGSTGKMRLYPNGKDFDVSSSTSAKFYIVLYDYTNKAFAGISVNGWQTIYNTY